MMHSSADGRNRIASFYRGKHILLTGFTGFIGKLLAIKILSIQPNVGAIYVLIQDKGDKCATERLQHVLGTCAAFTHLHTSGPGFTDKLVAVAGDVSRPGLGIEPSRAVELAGCVQVVLHAAASTRFDERFDTAVRVNTLGAAEVALFAARCTRLVSYVHVSTAYVNGQRTGVALERPLVLNHSIVAEQLAVAAAQELGSTGLQSSLHEGGRPSRKACHQDGTSRVTASARPVVNNMGAVALLHERSNGHAESVADGQQQQQQQQAESTSYSGLDVEGEIELALRYTSHTHSSHGRCTGGEHVSFGTGIHRHGLDDPGALEVGSTIAHVPILAKPRSNQDKRKVRSRVQEEEASRALGLERARLHGWQDTYVFTKAMGEMLVGQVVVQADLPAAVVRPAIVESALREPMPGWLEGIKVSDPLVIGYGKGLLPGFPMHGHGILDVCPVDAVVNAILAVAWSIAHVPQPLPHASWHMMPQEQHGYQQPLAADRHEPHSQSASGGRPPAPGPRVFHVSSALQNPLYHSAFVQPLWEALQRHPMTVHGRPYTPTRPFQLYPNPHAFQQLMLRRLPHPILAFATGKLGKLQRARERLTTLVALYTPYTFFACRFSTDNTQALWASLTPHEQQEMWFDVSQVDWDMYIRDVHVPGLMQHVVLPHQHQEQRRVAGAQ